MFRCSKLVPESDQNTKSSARVASTSHPGKDALFSRTCTRSGSGMSYELGEEDDISVFSAIHATLFAQLPDPNTTGVREVGTLC